MQRQLFVSIVQSAAMYGMFAYSYSVAYSVSRVFNMTHAAMIALGAYLTFGITRRSTCSIYLAIPCAVALTAAVGSVIDVLVFRPLRKKESSPTQQLLVSLGVYCALENLIAVVWGRGAESIRTWPVKPGHPILGASVTNAQIAIMAISAALIGILLLLLKKTKIGKAIRAVASEQVLASVSGIDSDSVIMWAVAIGSGLAGLAGILAALDVDITPTMGMNRFLMGVIVAVVGGVRSLYGIIPAALLLAAAQELGGHGLGCEWQSAIAFAILVIFLLFRPEGFLSTRSGRAIV